MDFDETRLYYSHQRLQRQDPAQEDGDEGENNNNNADAQDDQVELKAVRRHFREFLRKSKTTILLCCVVLCCVDDQERKQETTADLTIFIHHSCSFLYGII